MTDEQIEKQIQILRRKKKTGRLSSEHMREMEEIEGWEWREKGEERENCILRIESLVNLWGDAWAAHADKNTKQWIAKWRSEYTSKILCKSYRRRLEKLPGWRWHSFLSYRECQTFVRAIKLSSSVAFKNYRKTHKLQGVPQDPRLHYRSEWEGWEAFLGTPGRYEPALAWLDLVTLVRQHRFNNHHLFRKWVKEQKPPGVRYHPEVVYPKNWKGWKYFLFTPSDENDR